MRPSRAAPAVANDVLKVIGAGLGRTGTTSLHVALRELGFSSLHFDEHRLNDVLDGSTTNPDFRRYDDLDAVCDVPSALFYSELMEAYPGSKVILTVRDVESWWVSINRHFTVSAPRVTPHPRVRWEIANRLKLPLVPREPEEIVFRRHLRYCAFGSPVPIEHLYKRAYLQHNAAVVARTPPDRLLVMDITAGDGWEKLCSFLGVPIPSTPFPSANTAPVEAPSPRRAQEPAPGRRFTRRTARRPAHRISSSSERNRQRGLGRLNKAAVVLLVMALGLMASSKAIGCSLFCGWRTVLSDWNRLEKRAAFWLPHAAEPANAATGRLRITLAAASKALADRSAASAVIEIATELGPRITTASPQVVIPRGSS